MPISINSLYSVAKSYGRCKKIIQKITSTKQSRHAASLTNYTAMSNSYKQISEMIVTTRNQISNSGVETAVNMLGLGEMAANLPAH